jgi:hypothetical protein
MPFKSQKQKKLILAAAHNPDFAKKVGFEQSAAKKFAKDSIDEPIQSKKEKPLKPRFKKLTTLMSK